MLAVLLGADFVAAADTRALGPGKIARKYAATALRTLQPTPPLATDAVLDARHLHRRAIWQSAYETQPDPGLAARWAAVAADARASMTPEALLRL